MRLFCMLLLAAISGCAHPVQRRDWSGYEGPAAEAFQRETLPPPDLPDPLEPLNRSMWALNHALIVGLADPAGRVYRCVVPRFARDRVRDFAANLEFPRNLAANLLQANWREAGDVTARFAVNTTVGLAGLWDPAARWLHLEPAPEDFGQVFATWGWHPSTFLVLPIAGPTTVSAGVGLLPDAILDPATYFFPAGAVLTFNDLSDALPAYRRFAASSFDPYDDARLVYTLSREAWIDPPPPGAGDDSAATQTLEAAFLAPRDPGFASHLRTRRVTVPTTGLSLPYSVRMQKEPAPLVFLVPGLGSHRLGSASAALAEMVWSRGFSVAIVSSTLHPEFIERAGSHPVPGHAPADAADVRLALEAVARDLESRYGGRIRERVYLGYSLGAFHGFFIAAEQRRQQNDVAFDRFLLLDPPVRLLYGMEQLDRFYEVPLAAPEPDAEVRRILLKAVKTAKQQHEARLGLGSYSRIESVELGGGTITPSMELPFTKREAEFLIGLAFRRSLQAMLWASQERTDLGVLLTPRHRMRRLPAYLEIADYSFEMYLHAFLLPYYRDRLGTISSAEELIAMNDLHAIADDLRDHSGLRVFANRNDFLTSDEDVDWLRSLLGSERVRFFPRGGHLGNLHRSEVQAEVLNALEDLLPANGPPTPKLH
jgi:ABC-type transporter lipoprotein component MlaA